MIGHVRHVGKTLWWPAVGIALSVSVAALLIATHSMALTTILDGWGTGVLFSVMWAALVWYRAVDRPGRHHLRNATFAVLVELTINYRALALRQSVSVGGLSFDMYKQHGASVIGALDVDAALGLMALYRSQQLLKSYPIFHLSGWYMARQLDNQRNQGEMEHFLETFLQGVKRLDLSLDPAIEAVRDSVAQAYRLPVQHGRAGNG